MFLLVPAHPGFPGQIPQSRKTVVCVIIIIISLSLAHSCDCCKTRLVSYMFADAHLPMSQRPVVQPYQQVQQPRQQRQLYAEPHYATPRPSQVTVLQAADQREPRYDRQHQQQPAYRQYEIPQQEIPQHMDSRPHAQPQHPAAFGRHQQQQQPNYQHEQPLYRDQAARHEPHYQQQPVYPEQARRQYDPQQAAYQQRVPSAIEPSYVEPYVTRDGRIIASRSKSASDLNHPEAGGAWPAQPSLLQYDRGQEPPLPSQEPLSSWKSYEAPRQHGLASRVDMQEPVRVDRQPRETLSDGRRISPDSRQYGDQWTAPAVRVGTLNRQVPYWPETDRRSHPQLNVSRQQSPATYSSHPELSTAHQFVESANNPAPFTSNDLLRRAQPGGQSVTSPTPFSQQVPPSTAAGQGTLERHSVPVGGHLRAIDPKSLQHVAPVVTSERNRPSTYYKQPSQAPATDSSYVKPASRSQSLPRTAQMPTGAWERARKEEELRHVELEQKQRREDEIRQLESQLPDQLSPAEIDRLRRLKLSAEFDRRATELERTGQQSADTHTDMTPAVSASCLVLILDCCFLSLIDSCMREDLHDYVWSLDKKTLLYDPNFHIILLHAVCLKYFNYNLSGANCLYSCC